MGNSVSYEVVLLDGYENVTYNYAWAYGKSGWDDWSSTVKETGSMTSAAEGSFTPARPGTYRVWVDVADASGRQVELTIDPTFVDRS